jgi:hypothetical protein
MLDHHFGCSKKAFMASSGSIGFSSQSDACFWPAGGSAASSTRRMCTVGAISRLSDSKHENPYRENEWRLWEKAEKENKAKGTSNLRLPINSLPKMAADRKTLKMKSGLATAS